MVHLDVAISVIKDCILAEYLFGCPRSYWLIYVYKLIKVKNPKMDSANTLKSTQAFPCITC